jgi:hypothetical protein
VSQYVLWNLGFMLAFFTMQAGVNVTRVHAAMYCPAVLLQRSVIHVVNFVSMT